MSKIINLTAEEVSTAKQKASELVNKKIKYKYSAPEYKKKVSQNFFVGNLGEVAYGKHIGLSPNFDIYLERGDGGSDFHVNNDIIQVKTCTWNGADKELKADPDRLGASVTKLVLAYVNPTVPEIVEIIGEITTSDFKLKCTRSFSGPWMCVGISSLTAID